MTSDSVIDPGLSLGELVAERPVRAQLFEQLQLDYCCGGGQTLATACAKRGLELDTVLCALQAFEQDLHLHVHEENKILLPRARHARPTPTVPARSPEAADRADSTALPEALPTCCAGWIAEQTHNWAARHRVR